MAPSDELLHATRNQTRKRAQEEAIAAAATQSKRGPRKQARRTLPAVHPDTVCLIFHGTLKDQNKPSKNQTESRISWDAPYGEILDIIHLQEDKIRPREPYVADSLVMYCGIAKITFFPKTLTRFESLMNWENLVQNWKSKATPEGNNYYIHFVSKWEPLIEEPATQPGPRNLTPASAPSASIAVVEDAIIPGPSSRRTSITSCRGASVLGETRQRLQIHSELLRRYSCNDCSDNRYDICYRVPGSSRHCKISPAGVSMWAAAIYNNVATLDRPPESLRDWQAWQQDEVKQNNQVQHRFTSALQAQHPPYSPNMPNPMPVAPMSRVMMQYEPLNQLEAATPSSSTPETIGGMDALRSWFVWTWRRHQRLQVLNMDHILEELTEQAFDYSSVKTLLCDLASADGKIHGKRIVILDKIGLKWQVATALFEELFAWMTAFGLPR